MTVTQITKELDAAKWLLHGGDGVLHIHPLDIDEILAAASAAKKLRSDGEVIVAFGYLLVADDTLEPGEFQISSRIYKLYFDEE